MCVYVLSYNDSDRRWCVNSIKFGSLRQEYPQSTILPITSFWMRLDDKDKENP